MEPNFVSEDLIWPEANTLYIDHDDTYNFYRDDIFFCHTFPIGAPGHALGLGHLNPIQRECT